MYKNLSFLFNRQILNISQKNIHIEMSLENSSSQEVNEVTMSKAAQGIIISH